MMAPPIESKRLSRQRLEPICSRRLPNVLGNQDSLKDSFTNNLLDYPHYTRPESVDGQSVPDVLLSGNQAKIDAWRHEQSIEKTNQKRPDLLAK
jgi:tRNA (guanine37-N1)-methyltransferase